MTTKKQDSYIAIAKKLGTKKYAKIAKVVNRTRQAVHSALTKPEAQHKLQLMLSAQDEAQDRKFVEAVKALQLETRLYRPIELARLAGLPKYPRASLALQEAGIPHAKRRQGAPHSELVRFALTLHNTHELTARLIADLGGFHSFKSPSATLKRHGIPFRPGRAGGKKGVKKGVKKKSRTAQSRGNQAWQKLAHPYPHSIAVKAPDAP